MRRLVLSKWCKRWFGGILTITISLFLSGCWDRHELQGRDFVLAVAIDKADEGLGPKQGKDVAQVETFVQPHGSKLYRLSFQILQLMSSSDREEAKKGKTSTYVISNTGESMLEMLRDMLGQTSQDLWFEHVQTIVISEAAARQGGLQPMIDFFRRSEEIRGRTKIVMTSGEARPLLEYKPPTGEPSGMFIANSLRLHKKNTNVPGWHTDMGNLSQSVDNKERVLIARIELVDNIVKMGGMAVFKEGKFIGYMDEYASKGGKFIGGIEKSAIITFECPEHPGKVLAFELFHHDTKLKPHVEGDTINYTLDIDMRGDIGEIQCGLQHDTMDGQEIHKLEQLVAEEVKRNILYTFHTYQNLKVDHSAFSKKLKAYEPLVWENVKDHWDDEVFPNTSLAVSVNVTIEKIGVHK
jgi:Ger(x)C family germination protein